MKKKLTRAEREERDAHHARVLANAERTRRLAERAQARLDARADEPPRLAFLGDALIDQGGRSFEVAAALFAEGEVPGFSFFGHYWDAAPSGIHSGLARIRFSDGFEAEAALAEIDADRGGFRVRGRLEAGPGRAQEEAAL